jgi:hypothetical protein
MTKAQHTHETTCSMFNKDGSVLGEIDVRIEYVVLSQGMPPSTRRPRLARRSGCCPHRNAERAQERTTGPMG